MSQIENINQTELRELFEEQYRPQDYGLRFCKETHKYVQKEKWASVIDCNEINYRWTLLKNHHERITRHYQP